MQKFNIHSCAIGISNYRRPEEIERTVLGWINSTPDYVPILILSNTVLDANKITLIIDNVRRQNPNRQIKHLIDETRIDTHWGTLSASWNTLIQHILRDHEWVILSQDDVIIEQGWIEMLEQNQFYLYQGNVGDQVVCFGRELFNMMPRRGWYDERIRCVGVHDVDFLKRAIRTVGLRGVCVESVSDGFINPIGLYDKWQMAEQHEGYRLLFQRRMAQGAREQLGKDSSGALIGISDRDNFVGRECSQYILINRGAVDTRPYVDVALEYFKEKWGGVGISDAAKDDCLYKGRRYIEGDFTPPIKLPASYLYYYSPVLVYDEEEDLYYHETNVSPRSWKEGCQTIDNIDWAPWMTLRKPLYYGL